MAAQKKSASKVSNVASKKTAPAKKTVQKSVTKIVTKKPQVAELKTLRLSRDTRPFFSFQVTRQTVYWIIFMLAIIILQLVILQQQAEVMNTLDSLEQLQQTSY